MEEVIVVESHDDELLLSCCLRAVVSGLTDAVVLVAVLFALVGCAAVTQVETCDDAGVVVKKYRVVEKDRATKMPKMSWFANVREDDDGEVEKHRLSGKSEFDRLSVGDRWWC